MPLRKHDFRWALSMPGLERSCCEQCNCYRDVTPQGVTYSVAGEQADLTEAPCCFPPFDPDISPEDLDKAGYMPKPKPA